MQSQVTMFQEHSFVPSQNVNPVHDNPLLFHTQEQAEYF